MAGVLSTSIAVAVGKVIYDRKKKNEAKAADQNTQVKETGTNKELKVEDMVE